MIRYPAYQLWTRLFAAAFALLALQAGGLAQPKAVASLEQQQITIGDQVSYRLTVTYDEESEIDSVGLQQLRQVPGVEVLSAPPAEQGQRGQFRTLDYDILITSFDTGRYELPAIPVYYQRLAESHQATSNVVSLTVTAPPLAAADSTGILPIKDIVSEPASFRDFWPYLAIVGGGLLLLALLLYWLRGRKKGPAAAAPERELALPAYLEQELQRLAGAQAWSQGNGHAFQVELNQLLRFYLDARYDLHTREKTSSEILRSLQGEDFPESLLPRLQELLQKVDLVKFAKAAPGDAFHREALQQVREVVQKTKDERQLLRFYPDGRVTVHRELPQGQSEEEGAPEERTVRDRFTTGSKNEDSTL